MMRPHENKTVIASAVTCIALLHLLSGCGRWGDDSASGVRQTGFPGQVSAGGGTSGVVIARAAAQSAAQSPTQSAGLNPDARATAANAPHEGTRGQSTNGSVSGTPGIPEGSGGTTSGAAMGGTTTGAAATRAAPPPGAAVPNIPAQEGRK